MFDFVINGDYLSYLIERLNGFELALVDRVEEIYLNIDKMEDGWSGAAYNEFKKSAVDLKDPLAELSVFINAYIQVLSDQANNATELCNNIRNEFNRMVL